MKKHVMAPGETPATLIDARIEGLGDWRGRMLSQVRALIKKAEPDVVEEWKWNVPVWSRDGIICTGESYKSVVKLCIVAVVFALGAWNSRRVRPTLGSEDAAHALRRSSKGELTAAALVLVASAILVSLPSPRPPGSPGPGAPPAGGAPATP